jgi:hypothetical protein
MEKKNKLTKILAIAGTLLVWFPILAPILFFVPGMMRRRMFHFDYLMPAELFPFVLMARQNQGGGSGHLCWGCWWPTFWR